MVHRVAAGPPHLHARHDRLVVVDELQHAGVRERHVIIQQVAGAVTGVRMRRVFPLAASDDILRRGKRGRRRPSGPRIVNPPA